MRVEVRSPSGPREELPYEPPEDVECINFGVGVDPVEPRGHLAEFRTLRGSPGRAGFHEDVVNLSVCVRRVERAADLRDYGSRNVPSLGLWCVGGNQSFGLIDACWCDAGLPLQRLPLHRATPDEIIGSARVLLLSEAELGADVRGEDERQASASGRVIERAKESASLVLLLLQAVHGRGFYGSTPRGPLRWAIRGTFRSTLPASENRKSAIHRRGVTRQSPSGVPKPFLRARHFSSLLHRGVHEAGLGVPLSRRSGSTPPCSGPPSSSGPRRRSSR